ncbi:hypothetical protein L208DRAFT_1036332, partial [Tricholoma matsutake]
VVVIDGVTIGFCCCGQHNCHTPLATNCDCYCPGHRDHNFICAIIGCEEPVMEGRLTCPDEIHQKME